MGLFKKEKLDEGITLELVAHKGNQTRSVFSTGKILPKLTNSEIMLINALFNYTVPFGVEETVEVENIPTSVPYQVNTNPITITPQDQEFIKDMLKRIEEDEAAIAEARQTMGNNKWSPEASNLANELIEKIKKSAENTKVPEKKDIFANEN